MTNIRLRIEDAVPTMAFGGVAISLFAGTTPMAGKAHLLYRRTQEVPAITEMI